MRDGADQYRFWKRKFKDDPALAFEFQVARFLDEAEAIIKQAAAEGSSTNTAAPSRDTPAAETRPGTFRNLDVIKAEGARERERNPKLTEAQAYAKALESSPIARDAHVRYTDGLRAGEPGIPIPAPVTKASTVSKAARDAASVIAKAIMAEKDPREREALIAKLYDILP
jgi:hypothetical protein